MLIIVLILAWLIAFGLAVYLATRAVKYRLRGRQQRKLPHRKTRDYHRLDERQQRWVRKDGVVLVDEVIEDRRLNLVVLGWLAFVLWEGYGFGKLPRATLKPIACNCRMCFYFSFWSLYRWPCIRSFDGEPGGQRAEARFTSKAGIDATQTDVCFVPLADIAISVFRMTGDRRSAKVGNRAATQSSACDLPSCRPEFT